MTIISRPILRYHGGKWKLAPWIISHFPQHRVYTEVFGGAASVLLQKPRSYAEVYNDTWDTVVNIFRVLRDPVAAAELRQRIELTPFARAEFDGCGEVQIRECTDPIEKARLTIFRSFAGFGSAATNAEHSTGFRANTTRSGTTPAHDWVNYPTHIESFTSRLRGVVIENRDYHDVFEAHDGPETLHYVDPPYVHATRNMQRGNAAYAHEFTDDDHRELSAVLHGLSGMVVLSGYDCELYRELFGDWGGGIRKKTHGDGATDRIECLWLNPLCGARQKQKTLFQ